MSNYNFTIDNFSIAVCNLVVLVFNVEALIEYDLPLGVHDCVLQHPLLSARST